MFLMIEGVLALIVFAGSLTIAWGVRHFHLSTRVVAWAFAITAASWLAFLITVIGFAVRTLVLSQA